MTGTNGPNRRNQKPIFKNSPPFRSYKWQITKTRIDNAEDVDIVMTMYNLLEYSDKFFNGIRRFVKVNHSTNQTDDNENMINNNNIKLTY